jgi:catechol 2,3-dioxygenase-like lactoylglutathione lyase family enzyme
MKRFHVHVGVEDLDRSIGFYSNLFGAEPAVRKDDYAKWMLDDPRINFAISQRGHAIGVNHLGLQVESDAELAAVRTLFEAADATATVAETGAMCCYAKSDKHWVTDPQGIAWEAFHTLGAVPFFGGENSEVSMRGSCCN